MWPNLACTPLSIYQQKKCVAEVTEQMKIDQQRRSGMDLNTTTHTGGKKLEKNSLSTHHSHGRVTEAWISRQGMLGNVT